MLLTVTTTHAPATELGYLLAKNPSRTQSFDLAFGRAHVFYPEVSEARTTAALLLDLDPVALVRGHPGAGEGPLAQYVNDRPYVASSFLSVALSRVFASAMKGSSRERPALAASPIPLEARLSVVPCRGGEAFLRRLFEPLGYRVAAERLPLDPAFPAWGDSAYFAVRLEATCRLQELLTHLYVLLPVLDDDKHYFIGDDEVKKLLAFGEGWLEGHPAREEIVRRYLGRRRRLVRAALEQLLAEEAPELEAQQERRARQEEALEEKLSLDQQRRGAVLAVLREAGARSVVDVGCGEGRLLTVLLEEPSFERVAGMDVSVRALEIAKERSERLSSRQQARLELFQGALTYRDRRLSGFDAVCAVEVVEHLDPSRLEAFTRVLFASARPKLLVLTTPNAEYNVRFEGLPAGRFRHPDHRFEWTRAELEGWALGVAEAHGYAVRFLPVGPEDAEVGAPTQMAVFQR